MKEIELPAGQLPMKIATMFMLLAGLLLSGCDRKSSASATFTNSSSGNILTAPVDYLGAAAKAQKKAGTTVSSAGLTQAIKMFEAQEGRLPKNLNELVPDFLSKIPPPPAGMKYNYNPADGSLQIVPQ